MNSQRNNLFLFIVGILAVVAVIVVWPQKPSNYVPIPLPGSEGIHIDPIDFHRQGFRLGLDLQGGTHLVYRADTSKVPAGGDPNTAVESVSKVIERRINAYGVAEPIVQRRGNDRIIVELPGVRNIQEAKNLIGKTAQMDFREQKTVGTDQQWVPATAIGTDGVEKPLTGQFFKKAEVTFDQGGRPQISFEFDSEGAKLFGDITKRLVNKDLGIFLDDQPITTPRVQQPITEGRGVITGSFTIEAARELAIQLNAGALPLPINVEEERTVDATLGADSVRKSVIAGEIALLIVGLFMILYYRALGVVATLALLVYTLLVLAIFKLWPVTLTLAGIAGFILSIGMAVDANILIFERMKEELRTGRTVAAAIEAGFARAWPSIRDSNTSTLITCAILYWFGSNFGASIVMGFAITLAIGVLVSMFSAIVITRSILRVLIGRRSAIAPELLGLPTVRPLSESVHIPGFLTNLVSRRNMFFLISAIVILPGLVSLIAPNGLHPGIDFTSGSIMTFRFDQPSEQSAVRQAFSELGHPEAIVQRAEDGTYIVRTRPLAAEERGESGAVEGSSERQRVDEELSRRFGPITVLSFDQISPIIAAELVRNAMVAVAAACAGILAYLSWAFRKVKDPWRYGVCAVIALVHDAFVVLGIFSILGRVFGVELDALFIVALLTVIGFSVHDTIVVFDRVRENSVRHAGEPFEDVVNHSLLQTMGRSLTTSLTVLLTLFTLWLFGGVTIRNFVLALLIGIAAGTYSSIFNASMLLVVWENGELGRLFRRGRGQQQPALGRA